MRTILVTLLMGLAAVFIIIAVAHEEMRTSGIVKIQFHLPRNFHRNALELPHDPIPNVPGSPPGLDSVSSVAAGAGTQFSEGFGKATSVVNSLATRVSADVSQATDAINSIIARIPQEVTMGTDSICYNDRSNQTNCTKAPSDISNFFPSPLDTLLDLHTISSSFSAMLKIHVRSCLIASLVGILLFSAVLASLKVVKLGTWGIIPFLSTIEIILKLCLGLLVLFPLLLAAIITFSMPSLLEKIDFLEVESGNMGWCLATALGLCSAAICTLLLPT